MMTLMSALGVDVGGGVDSAWDSGIVDAGEKKDGLAEMTGDP